LTWVEVLDAVGAECTRPSLHLEPLAVNVVFDGSFGCAVAYPSLFCDSRNPSAPNLGRFFIGVNVEKHCDLVLGNSYFRIRLKITDIEFP
jgi:hypothetical protein